MMILIVVQNEATRHTHMRARAEGQLKGGRFTLSHQENHWRQHHRQYTQECP
jgi:hypothetical protein